MPESFQQSVERRVNPKKDQSMSRYGYPITSMESEGLTEYFKKNPHVAGMAIGGGANGIGGERRIVFNPFVRNKNGSEFSESQKEGLYKIEAMRHLGDEQAAKGAKVDFEITPEMQAWREKKFTPNEPYYNDDRAFKETIISRLLVGDDSPQITDEVKKIVSQYSKLLSERQNPTQPR